MKLLSLKSFLIILLVGLIIVENVSAKYYNKNREGKPYNKHFMKRQTQNQMDDLDSELEEQEMRKKYEVDEESEAEYLKHKRDEVNQDAVDEESEAENLKHKRDEVNQDAIDEESEAENLKHKRDEVNQEAVDEESEAEYLKHKRDEVNQDEESEAENLKHKRDEVNQDEESEAEYLNHKRDELPISTNGRCGSKYGRCPDGLCCSMYSYCGTAKEYCGRNCQPQFGICNEY